MYSVYITYFKNQDGTINSSSEPTLMFEIPNNSVAGFPVEDPSVSCGEDSADTFDFQMDCDSPFYDSLIQLKTRITVYYDGDVIFYGRVLTANSATVYHTKSVHCEGAYSFMNDSQYEGKAEKNQTKTDYNTYLGNILYQHNSTVGSEDTWKAIYRGTTTINGTTAWVPTNEQRKFDPSSWTDTMSLIRGLTSEFGGHVRIRYNTSDNKLYLDWYKYYYRDLGNNNRPVVSIGKNILDISSDNAVDDIFTMVIPVGGSDNNQNPIYVDGYTYTDIDNPSNTHTHVGKAIPVSIIPSIFQEEEIRDEFHDPNDYLTSKDNYGSIYKTMSFGDATNKSELWAKATRWIKDSYYGIATSFTIKAIDMHIINGAYPKILVGDCVDIYYLIYENGSLVQKYKKLVCKNVTYDLFNPENNSYTFGIPSDVLKHTYSGNKSKTASNSVVGGSGGTKKTEQEETNNVYNFETIGELIRREYPESGYAGPDARTSYIANGEMSGTASIYDPQDTDYNHHPFDNRSVYFTVNIVGKISRSGYSTYYVGVSPSGVCAFIYNSNTPDKTYQQTSYQGKYSYVAHWYEKKSKGDIVYTPSDPIVFEPTSSSVSASVIGVITGGLMLNNPSGIKTIEQDGATGKTTLYDTSGNKTIEHDGGNASIKAFNNNRIKTIEHDGATGKTTLYNSNGTKTIEQDGANNKTVLYNDDGTKTVEQDGADGKTSLYDDEGNKTIEQDGADGSALYGPNDNNAAGWNIIVNKSFSYETTVGGVTTTHTINPGMIAVDDLHFTNHFDSVKAKFLAVDNLFANYAQITRLETAEADIEELKAKTFSTEDIIVTGTTKLSGVLSIDSTTGNIVISGNLQGSGNIDAGLDNNNYIKGKVLKLVGASSSQGADIQTLSATDISGMVIKAEVDASTNTLKLWTHGANTGSTPTITFSKAASINNLTGSGWSGGVLTIKTNPEIENISYKIGFDDSYSGTSFPYDQNLTLDVSGTPQANPNDDTKLDVTIQVKNLGKDIPHSATEIYTQNFTLDASSVWSAGNIAGQGAGTESVRLFPEWDSNQKNKLTISKITNSSYSSTYTLYVVADMDELEYNQTTHKYRTRARAKAGPDNNSLVTRNETNYVFSGLEAYYDGKDSVTVDDLSWTYTPVDDPSNARTSWNSITGRTSGRYTSEVTSDPTSVTLTQDSDWVNNEKNIYIMSGGKYVLKDSVNASSIVTAAKNSVDISDTLTWQTAPSSSIDTIDNVLTVWTSGKDTETSKSINLYSNVSVNVLTATFYVRHTQKNNSNRIIKNHVTLTDSHLLPENIKHGVTIFGTQGNLKLNTLPSWEITQETDITTANTATVSTNNNTNPLTMSFPVNISQGTWNSSNYSKTVSIMNAGTLVARDTVDASELVADAVDAVVPSEPNFIVLTSNYPRDIMACSTTNNNKEGTVKTLSHAIATYHYTSEEIRKCLDILNGNSVVARYDLNDVVNSVDAGSPKFNTIPNDSAGQIVVRSTTSTNKEGTPVSLSYDVTTYNAPYGAGKRNCLNILNGSTVVGRYDLDVEVYPDAREGYVTQEAADANYWAGYGNATPVSVVVGGLVSGYSYICEVTKHDGSVEYGVPVNCTTPYSDGVDSVLAGAPEFTTSHLSGYAGQVMVSSTTNSGKTGTVKSLDYEFTTYNFRYLGERPCLQIKNGNTVVGRYDLMDSVYPAARLGYVTEAAAAENYWTGFDTARDAVVPFVGSTMAATYNGRTTNITSNGTYYARCVGYDHNGEYTKYPDTTQAFTVNVSGGSPDYSISISETGSFQSNQSASDALRGWSPKLVSGVPSSTPNTYRFIKFKVDGKQRSFYFS